MITYDMIEKGYKQGIVKLVKSYFQETACQIGDYLFYFAGELAEQLTPEQMKEYFTER